MSDPSYSYVLLSVGPVQGYISQARRTQDLFAGSRILSYLIWCGLNSLKTAEIIYPGATFTERTLGNIPNRLMFRCVSDQAVTIAGTAKTEIKAAWEDIAASVYDYLSRKRGITLPDQIWSRQVAPDNWLEVYYVIVDDTGDYPTDQRNANRRLAARKLRRDFKQQDEPGYKCTVTGEHEALHNVPEPDRAKPFQIAAFWAEVRAKVPNKALIASGEQLGAPATVRRFVHEHNAALQIERFPSTSSVASILFRKQVLAHWDKTAPLVESFLRQLEALCGESIYFTKSGDYNPEDFPALDGLIASTESSKWLTKFRSIDGSFFYPEGLTRNELGTYWQTAPSPDRLIPVRQALQQLYHAVGEHPSDYLAILAMDGDDFGLVAEHFAHAPEHTAFSKALLEFGQTKVPDLVEVKSTGRVIYAGGDDLLAVLPVQEVLPTAHCIATAFGEIQPNLGLRTSAGIAFVHRKHNLQAAIRAARDAQKRAKALPSKAAFGIDFLRRSGEAHTCEMKWFIDDIAVIEALQDVAQYMRSGELSRQLAHDLDGFLYAMVSPLTRGEAGAASYGWPLIPNAMREAEFSRIFRRRCDPQRFRETKKAEALLEKLNTIGQSRQEGQNWPHLITLLRLMRFISQHGAQSTNNQTEHNDVASD